MESNLNNNPDGAAMLTDKTRNTIDHWVAKFPADKKRSALDRYWIANMRILAILILIWATVSLGCGVLIADYLNQFNFPGSGYPLGFWFAQQGSIIVFVLLVLAYALLMSRLDRQHRSELAGLAAEQEEKA